MLDCAQFWNTVYHQHDKRTTYCSQPQDVLWSGRCRTRPPHCKCSPQHPPVPHRAGSGDLGHHHWPKQECAEKSASWRDRVAKRSINTAVSLSQYIFHATYGGWFWTGCSKTFEPVRLCYVKVTCDTSHRPVFQQWRKWWNNGIIIIVIITYIYQVLINDLSVHMIHINLNMIFCTHIEHSPTKTTHTKQDTEKLTCIQPSDCNTSATNSISLMT